MAHTLITGTTESGKSLLAKAIAREWHAEGYRVMVLDPRLSVWKGASLVTADSDFFMEEVNEWEHCLLIVDESGEAIGHYAPEMRTLATTLRHNFHSSIFIVQSATQLDPIIRRQCRYCAAFSCTEAEAKTLATEYPQAGFERAVTLRKFEYYFGSRFGGLAELGRVSTPWMRLKPTPQDAIIKEEGSDIPSDEEEEEEIENE